MEAMRAVWITGPGGPEVLQIQRVPRPAIAADQVLVRVRASALNRADLLQRQGRYPAPPGFSQEIPGIEFAGEIAAAGPLARQWQPGQRVFGLTGGGAHAEYLVTHERLLAEVPGNLSWSEAAAIPEAFITAHDALWIQAGLRPGESVLIHAVGSGVGLAAVQMARALRAVPYGTSRTPDKIDRARPWGLQDGVTVMDGSPQSLDAMIDAAGRWTSEKGINVVLDLVGGPYMKAGQKLMAPRGRMMLVGTVAGGSGEIDSRFVMGRRLQIIGTVLRARSLEEKIQVTQSFAAEVVPLFADGTLRPNIDSTFRMEDIAAAHKRLESNQTFGKVVVEW